MTELTEGRQARALAELAEAARERRALDERTRAGVLAARAAGASVRRVAEVADIAPGTVVRWVEERALELLAEGRPAAEVAAEVGARVDTVTRWAAEAEEAER